MNSILLPLFFEEWIQRRSLNYYISEPNEQHIQSLARQQCIDMGGNLTSIADSSENQFINNILQQRQDEYVIYVFI